MSIAVSTTGDYYILDDNMVAGVPKAGYLTGTPALPAKGHLVVRENAQANEWDICAATENPNGFLEVANIPNGRLTVALLNPGVVLLLPTAASGGAIALGNKVRATGAIASTGNLSGRSIVEQDAGGTGRVIAVNPVGTDTAAVAY